MSSAPAPNANTMISRYTVLAILAICLIGITGYSNTLHSPFCFDDDPSITNNASIRDVSKVGAIWNFWPTRFVTYMSLAMNYRFGGLSVIGYHIFNITVHILTAVSIFFLTLLMLSAPGMRNSAISGRAMLVAFTSGALFIAHPIQTQAVTYIIQRAASLATLFYVLSIAFYVKYRIQKNNGTDASSQLAYYLLSFIAAIIAMFTKEMTLTIPIVILLCEALFFRDKNKKITLKYAAPFLILLFVIPFTMLITKSVNFEEMHRVSEGAQNISQKDYALTQIKVIVTYIRLLFLPINQNLDYDYPVSRSIADVPTLACLFISVTILILALKASSKYKLLSFGIFWFFIALLPESGLIPIKDVIFEHRLYLPMSGFSIFFACALYYLCEKGRAHKMLIFIIIIIVGCSTFTYSRNSVWKDALTIWDDAARKSPKKARPYCNRGIAYSDRKEYDKAIADFSMSLQINPDYALALYNRGNAYSDKNNPAKALPDYDKAIILNPRYSKAFYNRGIAYYDLGDYDKAIADYSETLEIDPFHAKAYNNRGIAYAGKGDYNQAIADFDSALKLRPSYGEAIKNRTMAYSYKNSTAAQKLDN